MSLSLLAAFLLYVAAAFLSFGWFVAENPAHALGLVAIGLALQVLAGIDSRLRLG